MENYIDQQRSIRIAQLRQPEPEKLRNLLELKLAAASISDAEHWIDFAFGIDYKHVGLSSQTYLMHPLRVAILNLESVEFPSKNGFVLALFHNILEVSTLTLPRLKELFGKTIAESIETLTVDRTRQWDWSYKQSYYNGILQSEDWVGQVKIVDKLDNLYTLFLNPDAQIRDKYLAEVERWVIPMAEQLLPAVVNLLIDLTKETRNREYGAIDFGSLE
jgi:(p)ppGpp synthase/HD superfamily hydrolase